MENWEKNAWRIVNRWEKLGKYSFSEMAEVIEKAKTLNCEKNLEKIEDQLRHSGGAAEIAKKTVDIRDDYTKKLWSLRFQWNITADFLSSVEGAEERIYAFKLKTYIFESLFFERLFQETGLRKESDCSNLQRITVAKGWKAVLIEKDLGNFLNMDDEYMEYVLNGD